MSGTDPSPTPVDPSPTPQDAAGRTPPATVALEAEMDGELAALKAKEPGDGTRVRNPVFRYEQAAGSAIAADESTETAARVAGAMAADTDQERLLIERQVGAIEQTAPGSGPAADGEAAKAQAERDADEAVTESLDSDAAAEQALRAKGSRFLHRGADVGAGGMDQERALADDAVVARDLADVDALEARVAADAADVPPPTS